MPRLNHFGQPEKLDEVIPKQYRLLTSSSERVSLSLKDQKFRLLHYVIKADLSEKKRIVLVVLVTSLPQLFLLDKEDMRRA
uniref:FERM domain-containing protein n=1 Tax=Steinernema glaseri TaxID=37863 RepID=A0A1I7YEL2_9BILA